MRTWLKDFKGFAHKDLFDDNDSNENKFCTYIKEPTSQKLHQKYPTPNQVQNRQKPYQNQKKALSGQRDTTTHSYSL